MDENLERKTLIAELRLLTESGMQGFLHYSDDELKGMSTDELRLIVRNLQVLVRSLGGSRGGNGL